jgi:hypothetical protein
MFIERSLVIRRPNGIEEYPITSARYHTGSTYVCINNMRVDDHFATFTIETGQAIRAAADNIDSGSTPWLELNYYYGTSTQPPKITPGDKLFIPSGFDKRILDWVTNICQFDHEGIDDACIEVISETENQLEIKLTGETEDIASSKDKRLKARIYVHANFTHNPALGPSF